MVTSIVDYGAFVDLGGLEGLVHKDNISYGRVNHPQAKSCARATRSRSRCWRSTRRRERSPWASSSASPIPGAASRRNTPSASG
ncbi:MAG: S1 RNA-binding domain-containing protein [Candidatus Moduliflexus flocculans]|nr:S1 RNA-binding domain-containing protein [Candidatus Moduliflexus flocculans]